LRSNADWTLHLGTLADAFVVEGARRCKPFLQAYYDWNPELGRSPANVETMLEALTFGVLWNLNAENRDGWKIVGTGGETRASVEGIHECELLPAIEHFMRIMRWSQEYEEEARRMERFAHFFASLSAGAIRRHLTTLAVFGEWFAQRARELMGDVTERVDDFRMRAAMSEGFREDGALRARREVEYHLNLLSAVVLNGAWRGSFDQKRKKLLALPGCMRPDSGNQCLASETPLGRVCAGCTESCAANQAHQAAERHGIPAVIIEHQSSLFTQQQTEAIRDQGYALIGVACALSLQAGGWKARDAGIPAQCIPLDFAGCARHWADEQGIATRFETALLDAIAAGDNIAPGW
jgi:hypothetical protein